MPLLSRKAQIALEVESVEGTAETLVAADATMLAYDPDFSPAPEIFTREPARSTLSKLTGIVGKQTGTISWKTEYKGSGALGTRPAWDRSLRCCGFTSAAVSGMTCSGVITGGPFQPAETITGSSSGATGRIVGRIATGTTFIHFVPVTGTFNTDDVITGGTSGATTSIAQTAITAQGFEYRPISASDPSATVALFLDGTKHMLVGARGNVSLEGNVGEPMFLNFTFEGVYSSVTDTALLSPTYESTIPPALLNARSWISGVQRKWSQFGIDMQNTVAPRESANATKGVLSYIITERSPRLTMDPEAELVATDDDYGDLVGANTSYFAALVGSASANQLVIGAPRIQYVGVGKGDRNSLAIRNLEFDLVAASVSTGDNELQLAMI